MRHKFADQAMVSRERPPLRTRRWVICGLSCSALLVVFLAAFIPIQSDDLFMYLTLGRHLREGSLPATDPYLFSRPNYPWHVAHEWGAYRVFDAAFQLAGLDGVIGLKAVMITLMALCAVWPAVAAGQVMILMLLPLAAYAGCLRFSEKASLFSDILGLILMSLIAQRHTPRRFTSIMILLLFVVWVNLHPGFYVGFCLLGIKVAERAMRRDSAGTRRWLATTSGAILACLCNPLGWRGLTYPAEKLLSPSWSIFRSHFMEWMPTFAEGFYRVAAVDALLSIWCLAVLALALNWRKRPYFEAGVLVLFIVMGANALRFMLFSGLGSLWVISLQLRDGSWLRGRDRVIFPLVAVQQVALLCALWMLGYPTYAGPMQIGRGISELAFPVGAADFIERQDLRGRIFNETDWGSYLIWRFEGRRQVFYHGHIDEPEFLHQEYMAIYRSTEEFQRLLAAHDIGMFVLRKRSLAQGHPMVIKPLLELVQRGVWKIAYYDAMSVVLVQ